MSGLAPTGLVGQVGGDIWTGPSATGFLLDARTSSSLHTLSEGFLQLPGSALGCRISVNQKQHLLALSMLATQEVVKP